MRGAIDYREARLNDVQWWRRFHMIIDEMNREADEKILVYAYQFHLALAANSSLTEDSFKKTQKNALDLYNDLLNNIHPWAHSRGAERDKEEKQKLLDTYKKVIGDMSDPKFQAVIAAEVASMKAEVQRPPESIEERTDRLFLDRMISRRNKN